MADYGDVSGGLSDQAIRDIVAQLQGAPAAAPVAAAPVGVMPAAFAAPEVTPTMLQGTGAVPAGGAPLSLAPPAPAAKKAKDDDWAPPVATMVAPPVAAVPFGSPMGMMAAVPSPRGPAMGSVLGASTPLGRLDAR